MYAFRPADLPGGLSFLAHRNGGLRVGLHDRTLDTFGPEYITSQSLGLAEVVGNIGLRLLWMDSLRMTDPVLSSRLTPSPRHFWRPTPSQRASRKRRHHLLVEAVRELALVWLPFHLPGASLERSPPLHLCLYPALNPGLPVLELPNPLLLGHLFPLSPSQLLSSLHRSLLPAPPLQSENIPALPLAQRSRNIASSLFLTPCGTCLRMRFLATILMWSAYRRPLRKLPFHTQVGLDRPLRYFLFLFLSLCSCAPVLCVPLWLMLGPQDLGCSRLRLPSLPLPRSCWIGHRFFWVMFLKRPKSKKGSNASLMRYLGLFRLRGNWPMGMSLPAVLRWRVRVATVTLCSVGVRLPILRSLLNLSTGDINLGLCRKDFACSCAKSNPLHPRDDGSSLSCSFAELRMGPIQLSVMGEMWAATCGLLRLMRRFLSVLWQSPDVCPSWTACLVPHLLSFIQER